MSVTFYFQAPNTQTGGDDVNGIKIYSSSDGTSFSLEYTDTISASDMSYVYSAGNSTTYYRFSFTDADGYESPQSDTLYGGDIYLGDSVADIIEKIRFDIGDDDSTRYTYSDTKMKNLVEKAVNVVLRARIGSTDFPYTYSNNDITPDISEQNDTNDQIRYLIIMCVECMIAKREYKSAINKSIYIKDGDTAIRTTGGLSGYQDFVKNGPCKEFEELLRSFIGAGTDSEGAFSAWI